MILDGTYYIDDVPLSATPFAADPEFPARSSHVLDLLRGPRGGQPIHSVHGGGQRAAAGITIGSGATTEDLRNWAVQAKDAALPAGGAEFFEAMLAIKGLGSVRHPIERLRPGASLFADGSASAYSAAMLDRARRENLPVTPMPNDVFRAAESSSQAMDEWTKIVGDALSRTGRCLMTIGRPMQSEPGDPAHLQRALAEGVETVLKRHTLANLLLAGGATASAVCRRLGWTAFDVRGELTGGVVQLEPQDPTAPHVIVKPGSYPWPELVWWH